MGETIGFPEGGDADTAKRQAMMALAARASLDELSPALALIDDIGAVRDVRRPEIGLVMVRGRAGGGGAAFNLGEATVARAAVSLPSGETGFGYVLGRDRAKARLMAIVDALWQRRATRAAIETDILGPVGARLAAEQATTRARVAATKVDFFTMVRGDN
ncbi:MAG: phosphonate C-P lyase system protein PhnG [Hyphomicrobiaceae bacterium]|nr:phosphonate C-P lyase system protein PhnG [Hyphomicrobiaceae bacterium]